MMKNQEDKLRLAKETIKIDGVEYPLIKREITSTSHPFYTGKMKLVDSAGRIDKFYSRFGKDKIEASKITKEEASWRQPGENSSGPLSCYDSEDNRERRNRANALAKELNVTTQNIAGAWSLNQPFPSFALIGPRKIEEIDTSLPSLDISISREKSDWLNLKKDIK